jgi:hypothetical protein
MIERAVHPGMAKVAKNPRDNKNSTQAGRIAAPSRLVEQHSARLLSGSRANLRITRRRIYVENKEVDEHAFSALRCRSKMPMLGLLKGLLWRALKE